MKLAITFSLLYWLVSKLDIEEFFNSIKNIDLIIIISMVLLFITSQIIAAFRWWLLLGHGGHQYRFLPLLPAYYIGLFFNNFLPSGVGGDAVRAVILHKEGIGAKLLTSSILMDRSIGLVAVLFMGIMGLIFVEDITLSERDKMILYGLVLLLIIGIMVLFSDFFNHGVTYFHQRWHKKRILRALMDVLLLCHSYQHAKLLLLSALLLSCVSQVFIVLIYYWLAVGLGIELTLSIYFVIIPIVFLTVILPISVGGLGIREGVLTGLLLSLSVETQRAVSLPLLSLIVLWLGVLPGFAIFLHYLLKHDK